MHDLSQPLTACKFLVDELGEHSASENSAFGIKLATDLRRVVDAQEHLFSSLSLYVRVCQGRFDNSRHAVAASALAGKLSAYFARTFPSTPFALSGFVDSIQLESNHDSLFSILKCLLDNAAFHAKNKVSVSCRPSRESAEFVDIHVIDDGDGIPEDNPTLLGQSFTRLSAPHSRKGNGLGLGLFSAASIAAALDHGLCYSRRGDTSYFSLRVKQAEEKAIADSTEAGKSQPDAILAIRDKRTHEEVCRLLERLGLTAFPIREAGLGKGFPDERRPLILITDERDLRSNTDLSPFWQMHGVEGGLGAIILEHADHSERAADVLLPDLATQRLRMPISASRLCAAISNLRAVIDGN